MSTIRRSIRIAAVAGAIGAISALALATQVGDAAVPTSRPAAQLSALSQATTPSAACTTAQKALATANGNDKTEDTAEAAKAKTTTAASDKSEDQPEDAQLKSLSDKARTACETPACTAARQALATANANDKVEDTLETAKAKTSPNAAADKTEDQPEDAHLKSLSNQSRTACAPPVTPACTAARQALATSNAGDKAEDATEKTKTDKTIDPAEDKSESAHTKTLSNAVKAACSTSHAPKTTTLSAT
jgi:hypothetical protein